MNFRVTSCIVSRVALVLFAVLGASGTCAQALLEPGDSRLRSDIELLADERVIDLPLMTWPIPVDMLSAAMDGVAAPNADARTLLAAFYRVQRVLEEREAERTLVAEASLSDHPERLRTFEDTPRTAEGASLAASRVAEHWDGTLKVGFAGAPQDGEPLRFDGSYLQGVLGNWLVGAYAVDRWWGPGWDGSLVLGNAARPIPGLALSRRTAPRPTSLWFRWLGAWNATMIVGKLSGRTDIASPEFIGLRATAKPTAWLELAASRTIILCGSGAHCSASTWLNKIDGQHFYGSAVANPSVQVAGFDARINSPWRKLPVAAYAQLIGADAVGGFPQDYFALYGAEAWHEIFRDALIRAHVEWADTSCRYYDSPPKWNCAYADAKFTQGDTYRGFSTADSLYQDAEVLSAGIDVTQANGQYWGVNARAGALDRTPGGDPNNPVSATRQQIRELVGSWRRTIGDHSFSLSLGALHSVDPYQATSKNPLEAYASWSHRL